MSMRVPARRCFAVFAFTLPFLLGPVRAADEDPGEPSNLYENPAFGFRITRPGPEWSFKEEAGSSGNSLKLTITPAGTGGAVQVTLQVNLQAGDAKAKTFRDQVVAYVKSAPGFSKPAKKTFFVAGVKAPGLEVNQEASGRVYRVRQAYLVRDGIRYLLQAHAPDKRFTKYRPAFEKAWKSFSFIPFAPERREALRLRALAARCGSEVPWAADWKEAAARARAEKKPVLVLARFLPGFDITNRALVGPLMDPDVVALVQERFVPFRFEKGMEAPFTAREKYGMSPSTFGSSFLVVTPEGDVIGDTFTSEPVSFTAFLRRVLAEQPRFKGAPLPTSLDKEARVERLLRRGEYEAAERVLEGLRGPGALRLRAELLRRRGKDGEALEVLEAAREALRGDGTAEIDVDAAVLLLHLGRFEEARDRLARFLDAYPGSPRAPEARYRLGAVELRLSGKEAAEKTWKELVSNHEECRWAWKAAGMLTSTAFALGMGERLDRPPPEILEALRFHPFQPLPPFEAPKAEAAALEYLLHHQRPDGSWVSPSEVDRFSDLRPDPFTEAVTAICGLALLAHGQDPRAAAAVRRAWSFLEADREKEKAAPELKFYMDYSPWSFAYRLRFAARAAAAGALPREDVSPFCAEMVEGLEKTQKEGGGWSYYVTSMLDRADRPVNQSISFMTAAVTAALLDAREAGFPVPGGLLERALSCLERMREEDGTFAYFLYHGPKEHRSNTPPAGAAGRGPLCSLVLFRGGKGGVEAVQDALDRFMAVRDTYAAEKGKTLMHAGDATQGSHYLMFDYAFTAEAVRALPKPEQGKYVRPLLELVLGARCADGSYVDNPIIGRHYATAMALWTLHLLRGVD